MTIMRGVLADPALLETVLGAGCDMEPADGGLRVSALSAPARARLAYFLAVHDAQAPEAEMARDVHLADGGLPLDLWREAASEIMETVGTAAPAEIARRLPMIRARAASRLRGRSQRRSPASGLDARHVRLLERTRPYAKYFTVEDLRFDHARFDGTRSGPVERAVFVAADAVTVLPYDPSRDRVLLIEQVRVAPIARADPSPWLLEPVAGRIEPGDTPEQTARKEALEEARLEIGALHFIGGHYPSPGALSEYLYCYVGIADLPDTAATLGGLETENEDIRGHVLSRARLMEMAAADAVPNGPLLLSAFWLALHVDRLRAVG